MFRAIWTFILARYFFTVWTRTTFIFMNCFNIVFQYWYSCEFLIPFLFGTFKSFWFLRFMKCLNMSFQWWFICKFSITNLTWKFVFFSLFGAFITFLFLLIMNRFNMNFQWWSWYFFNVLTRKILIFKKRIWFFLMRRLYMFFLLRLVSRRQYSFFPRN